MIADAARRAMASGVVRREQVVAVSCTGQWASTVPVDEDGRPVGDCVMWMDSRGGPHTRRAVGGPVSGYAPLALWRWVRHSGGAPSTSGADPIGHMLYLEHDEPAVAARARWYLEPVDYLSMRFTGIAAGSHASMTAAWLTDNRKPDRLVYDPVLVRRAGVPADKLPPLVPTGSVVGEVRADVADELGLPGGVRVVTGTPDLHSAAVGSGAVLDYQTHLVISTTSWISCPVPMKKTDAVHQIASVPGLRPGRYLIADNHDTGGLCLEWLRDNVIGPADGLLRRTGRAPRPASTPSPRWRRRCRRAAGTSCSPRGWPASARRSTTATPGPAFTTCRWPPPGPIWSGRCSKGVAFNSRWLHEAVERFAKRRLDPLRVIGGGATSDLWCQIHADVMGRTIERVAEPLHANLRGAALFAALVLGEVDLEEIHGLVAVDARFEPDPAHAATYDRLFDEFPRLYRSQKPMFARLNGPRGSSQPSRPY